MGGRRGGAAGLARDRAAAAGGSWTSTTWIPRQRSTRATRVGTPSTPSTPTSNMSCRRRASGWSSPGGRVRPPCFGADRCRRRRLALGSRGPRNRGVQGAPVRLREPALPPPRNEPRRDRCAHPRHLEHRRSRWNRSSWASTARSRLVRPCAGQQRLGFRQASLQVIMTWRALRRRLPVHRHHVEPSVFEPDQRKTLDEIVDAVDATGIPQVDRILTLGDAAASVLTASKDADLHVVRVSRSRGLCRPVPRIGQPPPRSPHDVPPGGHPAQGVI